MTRWITPGGQILKGVKLKERDLRRHSKDASQAQRLSHDIGHNIMVVSIFSITETRQSRGMSVQVLEFQQMDLARVNEYLQ